MINFNLLFKKLLFAPWFYQKIFGIFLEDHIDVDIVPSSLSKIINPQSAVPKGFVYWIFFEDMNFELNIKFLAETRVVLTNKKISSLKIVDNEHHPK